MISNIRVVQPPQPIVSIEEAKQHIIDLPAEDEDYVKSLILAATMWLDGPTGWLGRALGIQTLELTAGDFWSLSCAGDVVPLPFPPVLGIESIVYADPTGATVTMAADQYVATIGGVRPTAGYWPSTADRPDAAKIRFKVGSAREDAGSPGQWIIDVPEPIKVAILLLVAGWYRTREAVAIGATVEKLPFAVDALLQPYRVYL